LTQLLLLTVQINTHKHLALHLTLAVAAVVAQELTQVIVLGRWAQEAVTVLL
jgi:hypothetical protein